jgi:hypothetical protein
MADQITQDEQGRTFRNGVLQTSSSPDPTVSGAISRLVQTLGQALAPRPLTQRSAKINQTVEDQSGLGNQF